MKIIKDKYRQKLLEAIVFFAQKRKLRNPSKMLMFKLLAELDFRHFQETGMAVTNLEHYAYKMGPVADSLFKEITVDKELILPADFKSALSVEKTQFEDKDGKMHNGFKYIAKRKPDLKLFTPRQVRIMEEVADIYKNATATEASKSSHEPGKPWTKTINTKGENAFIDMLETVNLNNPLTKELAKEKLTERKAIYINYGV